MACWATKIGNTYLELKKHEEVYIKVLQEPVMAMTIPMTEHSSGMPDDGDHTTSSSMVLSSPYVCTSVHSSTAPLHPEWDHMSITHSKIHKHHNMLAYHKTCECISGGIVKYTHFHGENNPADILSKHWDLPLVWLNLLPRLFDWESTEEHRMKDNELRFGSKSLKLAGNESPSLSREVTDVRFHSGSRGIMNECTGICMHGKDSTAEDLVAWSPLSGVCEEAGKNNPPTHTGLIVCRDVVGTSSEGDHLMTRWPSQATNRKLILNSTVLTVT